MSAISQSRFQQFFLLALVLAVSAGFAWMIAGFLEALFLAALFAIFLIPAQRGLAERLGGREVLAAFLALLAAVFIVVLPMLGLLGLIAAEAAALTEAVTPWAQQQLAEPEGFLSRILPDWMPARDALAPYEAQITAKLGEFAGSVGGFLVNGLSRVTQGTVQFFLSLFVMLYALFYFLRAGSGLADNVLACVPMSAHDKALLVERVRSVVRATVKGTFVIGIVQGGLAGLAFFVVGLEGAILWGTIMAVLSIIPGVGAALVWIPAMIYLLATGQVWQGVVLGVWCAVVVGTADNFLRPQLVGRDTQMPDLLVLLSTLGGLALFGIVGIILGPMLATIFIAVWGLYRESFAAQLGEA
jgi:predicted PurR-regulated permease PerM